MTRRLEQNMGSDAMKAATGRSHEDWRALLLDAGAKDWAHKEIVDYLTREHGVSSWWAQGITVDFEQAHQGRLPGQRTDGTFSLSVTRTIPGERLDALAHVADLVAAQFGERSGENLTAVMPNVRWRLADGTRLAASAGIPNKSGTPVNLTWDKLPDAACLETCRGQVDQIFQGV